MYLFPTAYFNYLSASPMTKYKKQTVFVPPSNIKLPPQLFIGRYALELLVSLTQIYPDPNPPYTFLQMLRNFDKAAL